VARDMRQWNTYVEPIFSLRNSAKEWNFCTHRATTIFSRAQLDMVSCRVSIKMLI
jgi:hypothetical protein